MSGKGRRSVANNKIICGQCRMQVDEENEENIQCDKCKKIYHCLCTKLDKRQFQYLVEHEDEDFVCHLCNDKSNDTLKNELKEIKTKLNKLDQLSEITQAIDFMSKQYDTLLKNIAENNKKLEIVQKENSFLRNEIKTLKTTMKFLNDHRVRNDCIIRGVEVKNDISATETLLELSNEIGLSLTEDVIEDAYFFKKRNNNNNNKQTMVVKFANKNAKNKLMSSKTKLKEKESTNSIYINDFLSKETFNLFTYAKTLKTIGYSAVYTSGTRVFAKKSELSKPRLIKNEEEVDQIMSQAVITKPKRRAVNERDVHDVSDEEVDQSAFLSPN